MSNPYFQFKQFKVCHDRCAMKVGTDGVLLGAWAGLENAATVLDIGTGTGLIALMAAQRNPVARIAAVELDADAACQAAENVQASPWSSRVEVICADAKAYEPGMRFDAIVSNPPYFASSLKSPEAKRVRARHVDELTFDDLLSSVGRLLADEGEFSVVIPFDASFEFIATAAGRGLYLVRRTVVRTLAGVPPKRVLLAFRRTFADGQNGIQDDELLIETEPRVYTEAYRLLTKDFYLSF